LRLIFCGFLNPIHYNARRARATTGICRWWRLFIALFLPGELQFIQMQGKEFGGMKSVRAMLGHVAQALTNRHSAHGRG